MTKVKIDETVNGLDRLAPESRILNKIVRAVNGIAQFYGFEEISLSPFEKPGLLAPLARAGLLEEYRPVQVKLRSGEEFLLPLSGALGLARAYFSHRLHTLPHPVKFFFCHRGFVSDGRVPGIESGALRRGAAEFAADSGVLVSEEWTAAIIGEDGPIAETEIIQIFCRAFKELGADDAAVELRLNAVGCAQCKDTFRSALGGYLRRFPARLCARSKRDLKRSPTRVLSCDEEKCQGVAAGAPQVLDFLCERCKKQLRGLLEFLDEARVPYFLDSRFFREGHWFTEIIFEFLSAAPRSAAEPRAAVDAERTDRSVISQAPVSAPKTGPKGSKSADGSPAAARMILAEGGRISQAAGLVGGRTISMTSGTLFLEAAAAAIALGEHSSAGKGKEEVFFVQLGELAKRKSFEILEALREAGLEARESLGRDSIKAQFKIAERLGCRWALILGQKESLDGTIIVRELESGIQETVPKDKLIEFIKKKLKK